MPSRLTLARIGNIAHLLEHVFCSPPDVTRLLAVTHCILSVCVSRSGGRELIWIAVAMAEKEATVYIVDVGRSMGERNGGRPVTDLEWAMRYVWDRITATVRG